MHAHQVECGFRGYALNVLDVGETSIIAAMDIKKIMYIL